MIAAHLAPAAPAVWDPAATGVEATTVEAVCDASAFLALEPVWNRLVTEAALGHPFLTHEWVRTWWSCFGRGKELHILLVRQGGVLTALAPLLRCTTRLYGVKVHKLQSIFNEHTPRCDFLFPAGRESAYRAVWNYLRSHPRLWDVLEIGQLPSDSRGRAAVERLAHADGYRTGAWHSGDSPYIQLGNSWDAFLHALPGKHRRNVQRRLRRLEQLGPVDLEVIGGGEALTGALADGFHLEAAAWKGSRGTAIQSQAALQQFYTQFAQCAAEAGWLRLCFLRVAGKRIAFAYGLLYQDHFFLLKPGYDPAFAACSPSQLLTFLLVKQLSAEGLKEFDFLGQADAWKLDWTKDVRAHSWLYVFQRSWKARVLHWLKFCRWRRPAVPRGA